MHICDCIISKMLPFQNLKCSIFFLINFDITYIVNIHIETLGQFKFKKSKLSRIHIIFLNHAEYLKDINIICSFN